MEDMISRKALCEYALNQKDKSITPNDIMRFPSAQPEIIRCKDCVHNDGGNPISDGRYWCMIHNSYMYYCSDGELRGDSDD